MDYDVAQDRDLMTAAKLMGQALPIPRNELMLLLPEDASKMSGTTLMLAEDSEAREPICTGIVLALGPGKRKEDGTREEWDLALGDRVIFRSRGRTEIPWNGLTLVLISEVQVFGVMLAKAVTCCVEARKFKGLPAEEEG